MKAFQLIFHPMLLRAFSVRRKSLLVLLFALNLLIGALEGAFILIAKSAMLGKGWHGWAGPLSVMAGVVTLRTLAQFLSTRLELRALFAWLGTLRGSLLDLVAERAFPAYREPWRNTLVTVLGNRMEDLGQGIGAGFRCMAALANTLVLAPLLFLFSWRLAACALALAVPALLASRLRAGMLASSGGRWSTSKAEVSLALERFAEGLESAAGNGRLAEVSGSLGHGMTRYSLRTHAWETAKAVFPPALEWFFFLALAALAWAAGGRGAAGNGILLMPFGALVLLLYRPIREWARNYPIYLLGAGSWDSFRNLQATLEAFPMRAPRPASGNGYIVLDSLRFGYHGGGGVPVLAGLDGEIDPGGLTWISGRNGAGKSTLLKLLAGIETPDSGRILVPADWGGAAVAYLPQKVFLDPDWESWAAAFAGEHPEDWAVLDGILGLERILAKPASPHGVSGGERQRLCLARAFASSAPYLLVDEPTTWLTASDRERILGDLLEFWRRPIPGKKTRGAALVSHEPFLGEFCSRTLRLEAETLEATT